MSRVSRSTLDYQMSELSKENALLGQVVDSLKGKLREEQVAHGHTRDALADKECALTSLQHEVQKLSAALRSCDGEKRDAEELICELHSTIKQMAASVQGRDRKIVELQREVQAQHERVQERALDAADSAIQTQRQVPCHIASSIHFLLVLQLLLMAPAQCLTLDVPQPRPCRSCRP
jgi:chromosome segregation ATPase